MSTEISVEFIYQSVKCVEDFLKEERKGSQFLSSYGPASFSKHRTCVFSAEPERFGRRQKDVAADHSHAIMKLSTLRTRKFHREVVCIEFMRLKYRSMSADVGTNDPAQCRKLWSWCSWGSNRPIGSSGE